MTSVHISKYLNPLAQGFFNLYIIQRLKLLHYIYFLIAQTLDLSLDFLNILIAQILDFSKSLTSENFSLIF